MIDLSKLSPAQLHALPCCKNVLWAVIQGTMYLSQCFGPGFALYLWLHPLSQILSIVRVMILSLIHLDLCLQLNLSQLHFSYSCCWRNVFEMSFSVAVREVESGMKEALKIWGHPQALFVVLDKLCSHSVNFFYRANKSVSKEHSLKFVEKA